MKVVNNAAEKDVKLHSDYAAILTDSGKQHESLPQVVEQHQQPSYLPITSTIKSLLIRIMDNHEKLWHSTAE